MFCIICSNVLTVQGTALLFSVSCFFRLSKHARRVEWSLGNIIVIFAISLTKTRNNTTASPVVYAGLHCIHIYSVIPCLYAKPLATLFVYLIMLIFYCFRIGPREKYFHCTKCNLCLATDLKDNHKVSFYLTLVWFVYLFMNVAVM